MLMVLYFILSGWWWYLTGTVNFYVF